MQYSKHTAMSTETKVALGILVLTVGIIVIGINMFKGIENTNSTVSEETVLKNINTSLNFAKEKVSPVGNPKVTGVGKGTATTSTSTAPIEVTEFMDYECPACAIQGEAITHALLTLYGSRITITRRIFPVHGEPSIQVGRMVLASQEYGSSTYQTFHTKVFETQDTWARFGTADREVFFRKLTRDLGMDYDKLVTDGKTKYATQIDVDKSDALSLGIRATPSFIVNNTTRVTGGVPVEYIQRFVDVK